MLTNDRITLGDVVTMLLVWLAYGALVGVISALLYVVLVLALGLTYRTVLVLAMAVIITNTILSRGRQRE